MTIRDIKWDSVTMTYEYKTTRELELERIIISFEEMVNELSGHKDD